MSLKEKNRNYFDGVEDVPLLIISSVATYGSFHFSAPIVIIGFCCFVDVLESFRVGKSIVEYIRQYREFKKQDQEEKNLENNKSNENRFNLDPKIDKTKEISMVYDNKIEELQINNEIENQNKSVKKFVLTKEHKRQY